MNKGAKGVGGKGGRGNARAPRAVQVQAQSLVPRFGDAQTVIVRLDHQALVPAINGGVRAFVPRILSRMVDTITDQRGQYGFGEDRTVLFDCVIEMVATNADAIHQYTQASLIGFPQVPRDNAPWFTTEGNAVGGCWPKLRLNGVTLSAAVSRNVRGFLTERITAGVPLTALRTASDSTAFIADGYSVASRVAPGSDPHFDAVLTVRVKTMTRPQPGVTEIETREYLRDYHHGDNGNAWGVDHDEGEQVIPAPPVGGGGGGIFGHRAGPDPAIAQLAALLAAHVGVAAGGGGPPVAMPAVPQRPAIGRVQEAIDFCAVLGTDLPAESVGHAHAFLQHAGVDPVRLRDAGHRIPDTPGKAHLVEYAERLADVVDAGQADPELIPRTPIRR